MKPVTLDLMTQYRYLSDMKINGQYLYYTETISLKSESESRSVMWTVVMEFSRPEYWSG